MWTAERFFSIKKNLYLSNKMIKKLFFFILYTIVIGIFFSFISIKVGDNDQKLSFFKQTALILSDIPASIKKIIITRSLNINIPDSLNKHVDKPSLTKTINNPRNALLVLSRYDGDLNRSIIEVIDLNNFEIINTYAHDINEMNNLLKNVNIKTDSNKVRFRYLHPFILSNGDLLSIGSETFFKLDICSKLKFFNEDFQFHHSINIDSENNFWVPVRIEKLLNNQLTIKEDGIAKLNQNGETVFYKSMNEILVENNIIEQSHLLVEKDPIHINDIQPVLKDSEYWKKGDVFISSRYLSSITHYRPSTNKVINYIEGPFTWQHDIDIISDYEISIFNNNVNIMPNNNSEVLIYNFKNKTFIKKFNEKLIKNNFFTRSEGLSEIFLDGALFVEEQNHGRFIIFDKNGNKEIEFINKDSDGNIYILNWSRIIDKESDVNKIKNNLLNKKC